MKKFLAKIYAFKFLDDFVLIYPLYAVMFTDFSMQPWQVTTLLAVWSTTAFFLEVPSGVWADKYSRKNILFVGQLFRSLGYVSWLLFPNFWGFLFGFVLWGTKSALTSGTFQALIYDELKLFNREKEFTKILGHTKTISFTAILVASALASPAILLGYPFVLVSSSAAVLIAGIIIATIPKAQKVESTHEKEYFSLLKEGLAGAFKNAAVLRLILFLSLAFALGGALDEYWPIFANETGLPKYGLGIFLGLMSGSQGVASFVAHHFEKRTNNFFYGLFLLNGVFLFTAGYLFSVPALLLLIVFSFLFTIMQVVFEGRLQHSIASTTRATISSVSGFLTEMGVLIVYLSFGIVAQVSDYRNSFLLYGVIVTVCGLIYMIFAKKNSPIDR
ncbi:MFS transporter [Candidatus Uhrbacteria bacterium]|nr:MFS transporter [Candidatus Uhrbacteria bacterium]